MKIIEYCLNWPFYLGKVVPKFCSHHFIIMQTNVIYPVFWWPASVLACARTVLIICIICGPLAATL